MNFGKAVISGFRNYINFSGRASRSEFWFFLLFSILTSLVGGIADYFLFNALAREGIGPIQLVTSLALLLPGLAMSARRLHDVDRTGWWLLITFTIISDVWLIIWWCTKGTTGRNRFGPNPLAAK